MASKLPSKSVQSSLIPILAVHLLNLIEIRLMCQVLNTHMLYLHVVQFHLCCTHIGLGQFVPEDWWQIVFNPSFPFRLAHMVFAAFLTTALVVGAVGALHLLRDKADKEAGSTCEHLARIMCFRCGTAAHSFSASSPRPAAVYNSASSNRAREDLGADFTRRSAR